MTLIVARVENGSIYILGDTALSFSNGRNANPIVEGCLKQYIVADTLAIAFAGEQQHFESVCPNIFSCTTKQEIVELAVQASLSFDLLVAEIGAEKIVFIKDGIVTESAAGFLGNADAFNAYQNVFHGKCDSNRVGEFHNDAATLRFLRLPEPVAGDDVYSRMFYALKNVIDDSHFTDVAGVIVPLCADNGRFCYINYADVIAGPFKAVDTGGRWAPIDFGTAANGGCAVDFGDDRSRGGSGKNVGMFFLQGCFGVMFPEDSSGFRRAQVVTAANPAYWTLETEKLTGHGIVSVYLTDDFCGYAGEELFKAGKFDEALFCYSLRIDSAELRRRSAIYDRYLAGYASSLFNCGKRTEAITLLTRELMSDLNLKICKQVLLEMSDLEITNCR